MRKIHSVPVIMILIVLGFTQSLQALPMFAKQTGFECYICHAGNQTNLNEMGRKFARSAYQMTQEDNSDSLVGGKDLATVLNVSATLKARVEKGYNVINGKGVVLDTSDDEPIGTNRGIYEIFKTSTLNAGGKVYDNVGALLELREKEGSVIFGGKAISSFEVGDAYTGVVVYTTNNYGPFAGMEGYNTGLYKPLRAFENHKLTNAAQAADLGTGEATGAQIFYAGNILFATVGAYVPMHNSDGISIDGSGLLFARVALEQRIGDLNLIVGAYGVTGSVTANNTDFDSSILGLVTPQTVKLTKEAYGVDLQLEGTIFNTESMLTLNAVLKNKTELDNPSAMNYAPSPPMGVPQSEFVYGDPYDAEMEAYSASFEFYPISSLGLKVAYLFLDDKGPHTYELDKVDAKDKTAYSAGFDYSIRQNIMFTMEYSYVQADRVDIADYDDVLAVMTIAF